jgi:HAMP domain-containing protein
MKRVNIENRPGLQRDISSGAVINTDNAAYEKALRAKELAKNKQDEINDLKQDVKELKQLMQTIIERLN